MPSTFEEDAESPKARASIAAFLGGVLGILWLFGAMFLVGAGVLLSGAARDLTEGSRLVCLGAGVATWLCGFVLIGLYLSALIKQRYRAATLAAVTPLLGGTALYFGPTSPADFWGGVPTRGIAVLAMVLVMVATAVVALLIRSARKSGDASAAGSGSIRMPTAMAAMVVGTGALALTAWVLLMSFAGPDAWSRDIRTPWGIVAWVLVLPGVWATSIWLWHRAGRHDDDAA